MSRFGIHSLKESHKKGEVFRVWTAGNFKSEASNMSINEGETVMQEVDKSKSLVVDHYLLEDSSRLVQVLDNSISGRNNSGNSQSENDAAVLTEASNFTTVNDEGSSGLLVRCNTQNLDVEQCSIHDEELLQGSNSVAKSNMLETHDLALVKSPRHRSHPRSSRHAMHAISEPREQHILKILEVCSLICQILFILQLAGLFVIHLCNFFVKRRRSSSQKLSSTSIL